MLNHIVLMGRLTRDPELRQTQSGVSVVSFSLAVDRDSLPDCLIPTASSEDGELMGIRHTSKLIEGIQYHPESVLTQSGKRQLRNFIRRVREFRSGGASC